MNKNLVFLTLFLTASYCNVQVAAKAVEENNMELVHQAWLIHHGIETSQWKDAKCKVRALELVDETKITQARLVEARELAMNASVVKCRKAIRKKWRLR